MKAHNIHLMYLEGTVYTNAVHAHFYCMCISRIVIAISYDSSLMPVHSAKAGPHGPGWPGTRLSLFLRLGLVGNCTIYLTLGTVFCT
jgi:hypothetical protein